MQEKTQSTASKKPGFLIHVTIGNDQPTRAALAFLVAKTAVQDGYEVTLFLAGDAVMLLRDDIMQQVKGLGTGSLTEHYTVLAEAGVKFYLSGNSSKARGLTQEELAGKNAEFALPNVLVKLCADADKVLVY